MLHPHFFEWTLEASQCLKIYPQAKLFLSLTPNAYFDEEIDLLLELLARAGPVLGSKPEDVGGPSVQASDRKVLVVLAKIDGVGPRLVGPVVLQPVAQQLPRQLLGWVPLEQRGVHGRGADHHGGPAWD